MSEYAFSVVVVDSLSNQPLANVQLLVSNTDNQLLTLTSDEQGVIQAGPLSQPLNQLQVSLSGYYAVDFDVLLAPVPLSDLGQIRLRPLAVDHLMPDLVVSQLDSQALVHDTQTLHVSGDLSVEISNQGNSDSGSTLSLLAFSDNNHNQSYEPLEDTLLGELQIPQLSISKQEQATVVLPIQGQLPFREAPISVWVDSDHLVIEKEEGNNIYSTAQSCIVEPLDTEVAFKPKLKWHWHNPTQNPQHHQILTTPVVAQLNDDNGDGVIDSLDIPDVIVNTFNGGNYYGHGYIRALSGADGSEIWPAGVDRLGAGLSGPAVGDLDNDGTVEIVTLEREGYGKLVIYAHDGTVEGYIDSVHVQNGYPMLVDLDNDGQTEIVVGGQVFNPQGDLLWEAQRSYYADESTTLAFDHDLDGSQEILVEGRLYDHTGQVVWDSGVRGTYAAVGNFDGDDYPEIVYKKEWGLYLLEHTGEVKWGPIVIPGGGGGPLTIADMDGDKEVEIGMAGKSQYIVFETDGSIKWTQATDDPSGRTGSSVFDFEGDGAAEILYSDEHYFRVYQGETGQVLLEEPNPSATWFEYPLVVDVDNDGHAEIVLVSNNYKHSGPTGVRVFENETDDWMATRSLWNQYHYRITNILDDGRIPVTEEASWLVHNTFRLNTIINEDILSLSDLTAAQLTTQTDEQGLNLSLLIGNAGMTENSEGQLLIYQDSIQGTILGSLALPTLAPGTSQTLNLTGLTGIDAGSTLIAHIDPDGQVNECQTQNNQAQTLATGVNGEVQLALDKSEYTDNETVQMNATLTNTGIYTADYQVQWLIESAQGVLLTELNPQTIDGLAAQSNQTLQQNWETGQTLSGNYQVKLIVTDSLGQTLTESTQPFAIQAITAGEPQLDTAVSVDKISYQAWDTVTIDSRVQNLANNAGLDSTQIELTVTDPNQSTLYYETQTVSALTPQQIREFSFQLPLSDALAGEYQLDWQVKDEQSGNLLQQRQLHFTVAHQVVQGVTGHITASANTVEAGDALTCEAQLSNHSQSAIDDLAVSLQLVQVSDNVVIDTGQHTVSLEGAAIPAGTQTVSHTFPTQGLSEGEYACLLSIEHSGDSSHLDFAAFQVTVTETPIEIAATLNHQAEQGRMLVLMQPQYQPKPGRDTSACWGQGQYRFTVAMNDMDPTQSYTLQVDDQSNQRVDSETLDFNAPFYPYNHHPAHQSATPGADVVIESLTTETLQFSLYTDNRLTGEWLANYRLTLEDSQGQIIKQSDPVVVSCSTDITAGQTWGDFTLSEIPYNELSYQSKIPARWDKNPKAKRLYLEGQLYAAGWSFKMVTKPKTFIHEMHTGFYSAYALVNRKGRLSESVQKQLREAVYRGESLWVMGCSQEYCRDGLDEALGIDFAPGKQSIQGLDLLSSPLLATADSLTFRDKVARGTLNGATLAANTQTQSTRKGKGKGHGHGSNEHESDEPESDEQESDENESDENESEEEESEENESDDNESEEEEESEENESENEEQETACHRSRGHNHHGHGHHGNGHHHGHGHHHGCDDEPNEPSQAIALTYYTYGQGQSVYLGFDLFKQVLKNNQTILNDVLQGSLHYLKPSQTVASYQALPVALSWTNLGTPQHGEWRFKLPPEVELIDADPHWSTRTDDLGETVYYRPVDFAVQPQGQHTLWLVSKTLNPVDLSLELWLHEDPSDANSDLVHTQDISLELPLDPSLDFIYQDEWGQNCAACDMPLLEGLQQAQHDYQQQAIHPAIKKLLELTDYHLATEPDNPDNSLRLWLGHGLKQVGSYPHEQPSGGGQHCR